MSHNVQQYDKSVFLRVAEAQRCRISSALFMPLFNSPKRDCVLGVFEVVQTERDVLFPAVVDWLRCALSPPRLLACCAGRVLRGRRAGCWPGARGLPRRGGCWRAALAPASAFTACGAQ